MPYAVWSGFSRSWAFSAIWNAWRFLATLEVSATANSAYPLLDRSDQLGDGRRLQAVALGAAQDRARDRVELGFAAGGHVAGHRAGRLGVDVGELADDLARVD